MNKGISIGIGVAALVIAFVVAGGSTMMGEQAGIPSDDQNTLMMGDSVAVKVTPAEEPTNEETNEGKKLEVNLVDGVSTTSTP